jgi:stage IV sporulation protein FB
LIGQWEKPLFIGEPPRTAYDLHFRVAGFPVRVHPLFWLVAVIMGLMPGTGPNAAARILIWVAVVFVSILIHELGHAFTMRYFGEGARVVLYSFGGLAIQDMSPFSQGSSYGRGRSPLQQILISAAGPAAGFVLAAIVLGVAYASGATVVYIRLFDFLPFPFVAEARNVYLQMLFMDMLWVNIFWGLMNLLPVYPLDGGQISREVFLVNNPRTGLQQSLWLSVFAAGAAAVAGLVLFKELFLAILFGVLAFGSYQILQQISGRGGGFGGGRFGGGGRPW